MNSAVNKSTAKIPFEVLYGYIPWFKNAMFEQVATADSRVWKPSQEVQAEVKQNIVRIRIDTMQNDMQVLRTKWET